MSSEVYLCILSVRFWDQKSFTDSDQTLDQYADRTTMNFLINNIKWVMLVSGTLTCTMFYGLFAPEASLESLFGASFDGTLENIVVRSWSALVGIMGAILIYGSFSEKYRQFSIVVAALSKIVFVALVFLYAQEYLGNAAPAIAMDCLVIFLLGVYLYVVRMQAPTTEPLRTVR